MIEEHKRIYNVSLAIVLAMAAFFAPFDRTVSLAMLMGIGLYYVYLLVLNHTVSAQLEAALKGAAVYKPGFVLRVLVLALPLLVAARHPEHFNILAAFAPLFICQIVGFVLYGWRGELA